MPTSYLFKIHAVSLHVHQFLLVNGRYLAMQGGAASMGHEPGLDLNLDIDSVIIETSSAFRFIIAE